MNARATAAHAAGTFREHAERVTALAKASQHFAWMADGAAAFLRGTMTREQVKLGYNGAFLAGYEFMAREFTSASQPLLPSPGRLRHGIPNDTQAWRRAGLSL